MADRIRNTTRIRGAAILILCATLLLASLSSAQQSSSGSTTSTSHPVPVSRTYPKEIRGYKVELAKVDLKKPDGKDKKNNSSDESDSEELIKLGQPRVTALSPFGITLEVPVTVAAVKQGGRVDFLTFEDMIVNGTPVTVNEYQHTFELPNDGPKTLADPISIYISTPRVVFGVFGEWTQPKEFWPVTGRAYVFGRFKKFLFKFKRVVPVELQLSFRNPLK